MSDHALLSPSSAGRWLTCTPSARLERKVQEQTSSYAEEGTLAHKLAELLIEWKLNRIDKKAYKSALQTIECNLFFNTEMWSYCEDFADYVLEKYNTILEHDENAEIFTETKVYLTDHSPDCWGTIDIRIVCKSSLTVIDLKYGRGVAVDAVDNKQLFLYALGALTDAPDVTDVEMIIYQPRIDNITSTILSAKWLRRWAKEELEPKAKLAYHGKGERVAGPHCLFCKVKNDCRAHYNYQMETVKKASSVPEILTAKEIADVILKANQYESWLTSIKNYAIEQAVKHNRKFPGLKLVESRSVRKYSDENKVIEILEDEFFSDMEYLKRSLRGITDLQKLLGTAQFKKLIEPLLVKPPGTPILAPLSDKRKEYDKDERALSDFAEFEIE